MGVPSIVGSVSHVEEVLINGLNNNNLFKTVGKIEDINQDELTQIFNELIQNKVLREKMSLDGQKFIDGHGSQRVINLMK